MKKRQKSRALHCVSALTKIALLMKLAVIIILSTCLQASANGYSQETKLTLDLKAVSIGKALRTIERKTEYRFVYSSNFFPAELTVNVQVKNTPVSEILSLILVRTGFTFKKVDEDLIVITSAGKQQRTNRHQCAGRILHQCSRKRHPHTNFNRVCYGKGAGKQPPANQYCTYIYSPWAR